MIRLLEDNYQEFDELHDDREKYALYRLKYYSYIPQCFGRGFSEGLYGKKGSLKENHDFYKLEYFARSNN